MLQNLDRRPSIVDAADLAAPCQAIAPAEACAIAWRSYGIVAQAQRFATEKDDTFKLSASDGRRYILKIAHPNESRSELDLQVALLRHLEAAGGELPVPRAFANEEGEFLPEIETLAGETRVLRLLSFLPGVPLFDTSSSAAQRERIGEALARLRLAMSDFFHPADARRVAWDARNLLDLGDLLPFIEDAGHRRMVERVLAIFQDMRPRLERCRRQVLHNDFNTSNIVVSHDDARFVTGIIDFGDAVRTAIAVDVSTALMNQMPKSLEGADGADPFDGARDLLRGYLAHADLHDEELELIPFLSLARLAIRGLLTSWRAGLFPENAPYILRNTAAGWRHLEWFLSMSDQQIGDLLASHRNREGLPR